MIIGIIEDSPKLGEIFKKGLELSENTVIIYESVQEATTALLETRFHNAPLPIEVLIIDLGPGIDGMETLHRLRQFISPAELPVILISGDTLVERHILAQNLGESRVLHKPITPDSLLEAVKAARQEETAAD